ncbi:hypothetical protein P7C73_g3398, partial [Tremellales sp. Uapishka_1]
MSTYTANWTDEHTNIMLRGMVALMLANRSQIYSIPGLAEVANNGGDRINKKIKQYLQKFVQGIPELENVVKEEAGKVGRGGSSPGTPVKKAAAGGRSGKSKVSPAKKRKVKEESESLEDEEGVKEEE